MFPEMTEKELKGMAKIFKNTLCPNCKTGADTYKLDKKSVMCPYLHCHNGVSCPFYKPISLKKSLIKK